MSRSATPRGGGRHVGLAERPSLIEATARDGQEPPLGGGRNPDVDFRGRRRSRDTHISGTDPQARLYKKGAGQTAKLSYMGHLLTENRHGLVLDVELTEANGYAEREAAVTMLERSVSGCGTLGADRGYDTRDFVAALRARGVTPHVAQHDRGRRSAVDGRTTSYTQKLGIGGVRSRAAYPPG